MIEAYVYSSCTSCRKTEEVLKASGAQHESRDFSRNRFTRDELTSLLERAGLTPSGVLSKRSRVYKARSPEIDAMNADALLDLMIEEPTLLRRPLVIRGNDLVMGHDPTQLEALVAQDR